MYSSKFKIEEKKLMKNLWGDRYYSNKEKKWANSAKDATYVRGFTQYILDPIYKVRPFRTVSYWIFKQDFFIDFQRM